MRCTPHTRRKTLLRRALYDRRHRRHRPRSRARGSPGRGSRRGASRRCYRPDARRSSSTFRALPRLTPNVAPSGSALQHSDSACVKPCRGRSAFGGEHGARSRSARSRASCAASRASSMPCRADDRCEQLFRVDSSRERALPAHGVAEHDGHRPRRRYARCGAAAYRTAIPPPLANAVWLIVRRARRRASRYARSTSATDRQQRVAQRAFRQGEVLRRCATPSARCVRLRSRPCQPRESTSAIVTRSAHGSTAH